MVQVSDPKVLLGSTVAIGLVVYWVLSMVTANNSKKKEPFLDTKNNSKRQTVRLVEKEHLSHDVVRFRFGLPTPQTPFGLPSGKHIKVFGPNCLDKASVPGQWNGRPDQETDDEIERKYSPVTDSLGHFDLMLKVYSGGKKERFPDGGKMSQYLYSLPIGAPLQISGPAGHVTFLGTTPKGTSQFKVTSRTMESSNVGFIAGGTGLTPLLRIFSSILRDPNNNTQVSLLFANQTEDDIFLRSRLDALQDEFPKQFHLWYTVDRAPEKWAYSQGFINDKMIDQHLPKADGEGNPLVLMCGPPPMIKFACVPNLEKLGFNKRQIINF